MKLDFLTPSVRGFTPRNMEYVCHWHVEDSPMLLSCARSLLLRRADTDLVLFVDDDVEFGTEHVGALLSRMGSEIGAVESNPQIPSFPVKRSGRVTRGWTGLTLLRREAVEGWNPPPLMRFEDEHLRRHVLRKGFRWIRAVDCVVIHHAENRGIPGPLGLHFEDGYAAWKVLPLKSKAWMFLKTPLFLRHGTPRFRAHLSFLGGMSQSMVDELIARAISWSPLPAQD